jgi:peptide/nickel transport system substrate-binding protein
MENRFGFKDVLVVILLFALVVMFGLKMVQDDRQWEKFGQIQTAIQQQTNDITSLKRSIASGSAVTVRPAGDPTSPGQVDLGDVFHRLKAAQKLPDYSRGDWTVQNFAQAVPTLNPLLSQDLYATMIQAKVIESLGTYDYDTLQMTPLLAKSWKVAPDGLSATVQLRDGVVFSDGHPMTADDVIFTYDITMDPNVTDGRQREYLKWVTRCEKTGPLEVKFTLAKFYEAFTRALEISIYPKHLFEKYTKAQVRENVALCMGTGPYRLPDPEKYTPGQTIELVRNERYWGEPGPWERIVYRIIEKESTELVSFRNREIDGMAPVPDQHVEMLKDKELLKTKQHHEYDSVRLGYSYIAWNEKRKGVPTVFADKRVRQAMTMLIDRNRLLGELYFNLGTICTGPFHQDSDQYDHSIKPWPYDVDRAIKQLLDAGFTRDAGGALVQPDGKPFEPELTYPAGSDFYEKVVIFMRDNLARAGITLRLRPQKWPLMLKSLDEKDFDAITLRWSGALEEDPEQAFHTRTIADGDNRNSYSNPELDKLIDEAHVTLDRDERMKIWRRCHQIFHEDQPYTFLIRSYAIGWFDNRIRNIIKVPRIGLNAVSIWPNPIEWYVPKELQARGK